MGLLTACEFTVHYLGKGFWEIGERHTKLDANKAAAAGFSQLNEVHKTQLLLRLFLLEKLLLYILLRTVVED